MSCMMIVCQQDVSMFELYYGSMPIRCLYGMSCMMIVCQQDVSWKSAKYELYDCSMSAECQ